MPGSCAKGTDWPDRRTRGTRDRRLSRNSPAIVDRLTSYTKQQQMPSVETWQRRPPPLIWRSSLKQQRGYRNDRPTAARYLFDPLPAATFEVADIVQIARGSSMRKTMLSVR